jgi:glycosyltransferase involved in cell wall biosynthesis
MSFMKDEIWERDGAIHMRSNCRQCWSVDSALDREEKRLKVVIVSAVFPPEPMVSAQTSVQLAEELVRRGHSVQVLAPLPNRPKGKLFDGYTRSLYSTSESEQGYSITHCWSFFSPYSAMLNRFAENLSFGITSGLRLLCGKRPDVIYSNSWAVFATGIVICVARLRTIPVVLSVQDVYPESLESQGRVAKRGCFYRLLRKCDQMILHSAKEIIVISEGFRKFYETDRGICSQRLHVVPNWGSDDLFQADPKIAREFRQKLGIPAGSFVAVYAGNVGVASNAEMLVDVFAKLKTQARIYLVIAGDGSRLYVCREKIARQNLDRVIIHSPWKKEETGPVLQMADLLLLPTKAEQSLLSIPSKLISYFLSGRPVLAAVLSASDTAVAVRDHGAGWVVEPDSVEAMKEAILAAGEMSGEALSRMGLAGRTYALLNLTRGANLPHLVQVVEDAAR